MSDAIKKQLSLKQLDVYDLWRSGTPSPEIANMLNIAPSTVRYHIANIRAVINGKPKKSSPNVFTWDMAFDYYSKNKTDKCENYGCRQTLYEGVRNAGFVFQYVKSKYRTSPKLLDKFILFQSKKTIPIWQPDETPEQAEARRKTICKWNRGHMERLAGQL